MDMKKIWEHTFVALNPSGVSRVINWLESFLGECLGGPEARRDFGTVFLEGVLGIWGEEETLGFGIGDPFFLDEDVRGGFLGKLTWGEGRKSFEARAFPLPFAGEGWTETSFNFSKSLC